LKYLGLLFAFSLFVGDIPDPSPAPFLRVEMENIVRRHDIVYDQPALRPNEYMPLGNGNVGLMIDPFGSQTFGGWITKSDMWLELHQDPVLSGLFSLQDVQTRWAQGGQAAFQRMKEEEDQSSDNRQGRVRPRVVGQVRAELRAGRELLSDLDSIAHEYEQRLDIYDANCSTRFSWPGRASSESKAFVHSGKDLIVFQYSDRGEAGKALSRRISLARPVWELYKFQKNLCCPLGGKGVAGREAFTVKGDKKRNVILLEYSNASGLKATLALRAVGPKVRLVVERAKDPNATFDLNLAKPVDYLNPLPMLAGNAFFEAGPAPRLDVTVFAALATNGDAPDPTAAALSILDASAPMAWSDLVRTHQDWWRDFWKRSFIELADQDIENYWYHQSYQLASTSRGKFPPGICQLWVAAPEWPWQGGYVDFNNAAMHMAVQVTNHPELGDPYWRLMRHALPGFRENAKRLYGARGIALPHTFGPDGYEGSTITWRYQFYHTALVGILQHWRYLYSQDRDLLRSEIYPFLKEAIQYYQDLLEWDEVRKQYNMPVPACTLNEGGGGQDFNKRNDPFDLASIRRLVLSGIEASEVLGSEVGLREQWRDFYSKIAPFANDGKRYLVYQGERKSGVPLVLDTLGLAFPTGMVDTNNDPLWSATIGDVVAHGMGGQCFTGMMWASAAAWSGLGDTLSTAMHAEMRRHLFPNGIIGEGVLTFLPEYGRAVPGVIIGESGPWAPGSRERGPMPQPLRRRHPGLLGPAQLLPRPRDAGALRRVARDGRICRVR